MGVTFDLLIDTALAHTHTLEDITGLPGFITSYTDGGIVFGEGGVLVQDTSQFFYDNSTNSLGLGTNTPHAKIEIVSGNILVNTTTQDIDGGNKMAIKGTSTASGNAYYVATDQTGARQMYFGVTSDNAFLGAYLNHSFELRVNNAAVTTYTSAYSNQVIDWALNTTSPRGYVDAVGVDAPEVHDEQPDNAKSVWVSPGKGGSDLEGNFNGGSGGDIVLDPGTPGSGNEVGQYGAVRVIDRLTADPLSPTGYKEVFSVTANGGAGQVNFYDSQIFLTSFAASSASFGPTGASPLVPIIAAGIDATHQVVSLRGYESATADLIKIQKTVSSSLVDVFSILGEGPMKVYQASSAPTYVKGAVYFDTTLNKLRVGGASAWETITSV